MDSSSNTEFAFVVTVHLGKVHSRVNLTDPYQLNCIVVAFCETSVQYTEDQEYHMCSTWFQPPLCTAWTGREFAVSVPT